MAAVTYNGGRPSVGDGAWITTVATGRSLYVVEDSLYVTISPDIGPTQHAQGSVGPLALRVTVSRRLRRGRFTTCRNVVFQRSSPEDHPVRVPASVPWHRSVGAGRTIDRHWGQMA